MPRQKLDAKTVAALATEKVQEDFWDTHTTNFGVRVSRTGRKVFVLRYRPDDSPRYRRETLGRVGVLSLKEARERAKARLAAVADGDDPAAHRDENVATAFAEVARAVMERTQGRLADSTRRERTRIIENILIPAWGDRAISTISREDAKSLQGSLAATPAQANRVLAVVSVIFEDVLDDERESAALGVTTNPARRTRKWRKLKERRRDVTLTHEEIRRFWHELASEPSPYSLAMRFALLIGNATRIGPIREMRWEDLRGSSWRVPSSRLKSPTRDFDLIVPLSAQAQELLAGLRGGHDDWVFPTQRGNATAGHIRRTDHIVRRVRGRIGGQAFTAHDLRQTFRTYVGRDVSLEDPDIERGCGPYSAEVIDAVLGHADDSVGFQHYQGNKAEYLLSAKRRALGAWAEFVMEIVR